MQQHKREMGGYLELERFSGHEYHKGALALNCARNCLAYLIEARKIETLWVPSFLCASVDTVAERFGVTVRHYEIKPDFTPEYESFVLSGDEYLYIVDYYGQLPESALVEACNRADGRTIIDEVMAFFRKALPHVDTIYSCRKFFGVADGAYLYTDARIGREIKTDESHNRMGFVLGRCERPANDFYSEAAANNSFFVDQDIKWMSPLTHNLLRGIDYAAIAEKREKNFNILAQRFADINEIAPVAIKGAFMYPLLIANGAAVRKRLQQQKIYVSTLWPYATECEGLSGRYARDILPLVIDQRYDEADMEYESDALEGILAEMQAG